MSRDTIDMWVVIDDEGDIHGGSLGYSEDHAIDCFLTQFTVGEHQDWCYWRNIKGYTTEQIQVTRGVYDPILDTVDPDYSDSFER